MSAVITLLSDLGTRDATVMIAKAVITQSAPDALIIDISHHVEQFDVQQAAFLLSGAYRHFPPGAIHVLLVDMFRGHTPTMLLAQKDGFYFIAPDNGILPLALSGEPEKTWLCFEFTRPYDFRKWMKCVGNVIGALLSGTETISYTPFEIQKVPRAPEPKVFPDGVECNILYIDRYGNVTLSITRDQFYGLIGSRPFKIRVTRTQFITAVSENYNDVPAGELLCRFNVAGYLEIAINHDKASGLLGLGAYNTGNLQYQTIKILT